MVNDQWTLLHRHRASPEYFQSEVERIRAATAQGDMFLGQNRDCPATDEVGS